MSNQRSDIAIIIPAYNETENIKILVERILKNLPKSKIIVVDDSSPEENKKLKQSIQKTRGDIHIISRMTKDGRGSAVITGFRYALQDKKNKYFFEMDADLAHNPDEFSRFLEKQDTADLVIGSRYLSQSNITKWPLKRLLMSKTINFILKFWLGLHLSDYTNGFRLYNRNAVEYLNSIQLKEKGFILLSEIAYRLKKNKFKISEVPISFTDRKYGKSNADLSELLKSLKGAIRIRFSRLN